MKYAKKLIIIWLVLLVIRYGMGIGTQFMSHQTRIIQRDVNKIIYQLENSLGSIFE